MNKIYTAKDYAKMRDGVETVVERLKVYQAKFKRKGFNITIKGIDKKPSGKQVKARIWQGHWIADCECGGAEFVDPQEPIFFCFSCGNSQNANRLRPVKFPINRQEIEAKILERPVNTTRGLDELQRAEAAQPMLYFDGKPLTRSWLPGETIAILEKQQDEAIKKYRKKATNGI